MDSSPMVQSLPVSVSNVSNHWQVRSIPDATRLILNPGEVHLWRIDLGCVPSQWNETLSPDEHERAHRFHFERHRHDYLAAHAALRVILCQYLGTSSGEIQFGQSERGKPFISEPIGSIRFNLSHSGDRMILAVAMGMEVGVDLEEMRHQVAFDEIAALYFDEACVTEIRNSPISTKPTCFFRHWTRLEARLKAIGAGLGAPSVETSDWEIQDLDVFPAYAGALATEAGKIDRLHLFEPAWQVAR